MKVREMGMKVRKGRMKGCGRGNQGKGVMQGRGRGKKVRGE